MPNLDSRITFAERYYVALSGLHFESTDEWATLYNKYISDKSCGLPELLVLIHPSWYESLGIPDPRGGRNFPSADKNAQCRSIEFYGYPCPFIDPLIHVDHQFPYSKGGVTSHANAMYLCEEHNLSKSTDIHIINWENMDTTWVLSLLQIFTHEVERRTQRKFPKISKTIART